MVTSARIRAGRGSLKWTRRLLAARASFSIVSLDMIESDQDVPRTGTLDAIGTAPEGEGLRFIGDADEGFGVMPPARTAGTA